MTVPVYHLMGTTFSYLSDQQVLLGVICALLCKLLKAMVERARGIFSEVTEHLDVDHYWRRCVRD